MIETMARTFMIFAVLLVCVVYSNAVCTAVYERGVSEADKRIIVDLHNNIRQQIARGELKGQPKGKNFKTIKYDETIARAAQSISDSCEFKHVPVKDGRWSVGQNLYMSMSTASNKGSDWRVAIQSWIDEYKKYQYGEGFKSSTGHYTQVVWANTEYIGCGYTFFAAPGTYKYRKLYTCNYGPAGNIIGQNPYPLAL